jgi:hypothetical protein
VSAGVTRAAAHRTGSVTWLRAAPKLIGHLFPRLLDQPEYNTRLKAAAPLMEAALRWLAALRPSSGR